MIDMDYFAPVEFTRCIPTCSKVFEKIVIIVVKVVQILEFAMTVFFGDRSDSSADVD